MATVVIDGRLFPGFPALTQHGQPEQPVFVLGLRVRRDGERLGQVEGFTPYQRSAVDHIAFGHLCKRHIDWHIGRDVLPPEPVHVGIDDAHVVAIEALHPGPQIVGTQKVIRIQKADHLRASGLKAGLPRKSHIVVVDPKVPNAGRLPAFGDLGRVVLGRIVDDQDLIGPSTLVQHALDALVEIAAVVVAGNDHGETHRPGRHPRGRIAGVLSTPERHSSVLFSDQFHIRPAGVGQYPHQFGACGTERA